MRKLWWLTPTSSARKMCELRNAEYFCKVELHCDFCLESTPVTKFSDRNCTNIIICVLMCNHKHQQSYEVTLKKTVQTVPNK